MFAWKGMEFGVKRCHGALDSRLKTVLLRDVALIG